MLKRQQAAALVGNLGGLDALDPADKVFFSPLLNQPPAKRRRVQRVQQQAGGAGPARPQARRRQGLRRRFCRRRRVLVDDAAATDAAAASSKAAAVAGDTVGELEEEAEEAEEECEKHQKQGSGGRRRRQAHAPTIFADDDAQHVPVPEEADLQQRLRDAQGIDRLSQQLRLPHTGPLKQAAFSLSQFVFCEVTMSPSV